MLLMTTELQVFQLQGDLEAMPHKVALMVAMEYQGWSLSWVSQDKILFLKSQRWARMLLMASALTMATKMPRILMPLVALEWIPGTTQIL